MARLASLIMRLPSARGTAAFAAVERARSLSSIADSDRNQQFQAESSLKQAYPSKRLVILRHGQAQHNPRAEKARENGCDFDEFLRLMEEDDALDAALTELGEDQARTAGDREHIKRALSNIELVGKSFLFASWPTS